MAQIEDVSAPPFGPGQNLPHPLAYQLRLGE